MLKKLLKNKVFVFSLFILIPMFIIAIFGSIFAPYDPLTQDASNTLQSSSWDHLLGTDEYGRDILSRLLVGVRPTMIIALVSTTISMFIGVILGILAGYIRGALETIILRSLDIILSFPPILLALIVVGFWGAGIKNMILVISIVYIPYFARVAHSATVQVKEMEFVESEISLGASFFRIIKKSILPNIISPLIIQVSLTFAAVILLASGLSFLGLGIIPPDPDWGQMIGVARGYIYQNPMYVIWPSMFLGLTMLAINLMGDSLRDVLDPKLKNK